MGRNDRPLSTSLKWFRLGTILDLAAWSPEDLAAPVPFSQYSVA
jgi:hypothetical protein